MRHGYFLAKENACFGDKEFAEEAKKIWDEKFSSSHEGEFHSAQRFNGISIFEKENGIIIKRVSYLNIFSDVLKVQTMDL